MRAPSSEREYLAFAALLFVAMAGFVLTFTGLTMFLISLGRGA